MARIMSSFLQKSKSTAKHTKQYSLKPEIRKFHSIRKQFKNQIETIKQTHNFILKT